MLRAALLWTVTSAPTAWTGRREAGAAALVMPAPELRDLTGLGPIQASTGTSYFDRTTGRALWRRSCRSCRPPPASPSPRCARYARRAARLSRRRSGRRRPSTTSRPSAYYAHAMHVPCPCGACTMHVATRASFEYMPYAKHRSRSTHPPRCAASSSRRSPSARWTVWTRRPLRRPRPRCDSRPRPSPEPHQASTGCGGLPASDRRERCGWLRIGGRQPCLHALHAARRPAGAGGSGRGPVPTPGPDHRTTPPSLR